MLLEKIEHVNDIKKINKEDYGALAQEIRNFLIEKILTIPRLFYRI